MDFTGTLAETVDMQKGRYTELVEEKYKLFRELYKTFTKGGLICCSIEVCIYPKQPLFAHLWQKRLHNLVGNITLTLEMHEEPLWDSESLQYTLSPGTEAEELGVNVASELM